MHTGRTARIANDSRFCDAARWSTSKATSWTTAERRPNERAATPLLRPTRRPLARRPFGLRMSYRPGSITLQWVMAEPDRHLSLTGPALVCRWTSTPASERDGHTIDGLGPCRRARRPALRVRSRPPPGMSGPEPDGDDGGGRETPITDDAWQR